MSYFSTTQQMLALSYMAYYGYSKTGNDRKNAQFIAGEIDKALVSWTPIAGDWQRVWGPAVFALPGTEFDDSLLYVVRHISKPNTFAVVVRGTNPISIPNWIIWDFQAKELRLWPGYQGDLGDNNPDRLPCLSESSYFGMMVIQSLRPPLGVLGCNQSLLQFFQQQKANHGLVSITTTGHSLGGALSPLVALWLHEENVADVVETVTFAAPTPGNKVFADYFNDRLGSHCTRIANGLDIVTLAWDEALMNRMLTLYLGHFPPLFPTPPLMLMLDTLRRRARGKHYHHIGDTSAVFPGEFKPIAIPYLTQALYQHVLAYPKLMNMDKHIPKDSWFPVSSLLSEELKHFSI